MEMKSNSKVLILTWGLILMLLFSLSLSGSGAQLNLKMNEIAQRADLIFAGTVDHSEQRLNDKGIVLTDTTFKNVRQIYSSKDSVQQSSPKITITYAGGAADDKKMVVTSQPNFQNGSRYLVLTFDDGLTYVNPIVGGDQGYFKIIKDTENDKSYLLTPGNKAVVDVKNDEVVTSSQKVKEVSNQRIIPKKEDGKTFKEPAPSAKGPENSVSSSRVSNDILSRPLSLEEFIQYLKQDALVGSIGRSKIKMDRSKEGTDFGDNGAKEEYWSFFSQSLQDDQSEEEAIEKPPNEMSVPKGTGFSSDSGADGLKPVQPLGGNLGACGYHNLNIVMEQVSEGWFSYDVQDSSMWTWNQFMDLYRYKDDDGTFGDNGENEFAGFVDDSTLYDTYGIHWGSGIGVTLTWLGFLQPECGKIVQSDVMYNPAYDWTHDPDEAKGGGPILQRPVTMHELGHTWGYMVGKYNETYDYDDPSVMQGYNSYVIEDGWGIHVPDAYLVRRHYDDKTSILDIKDVGVESYYANDGLNSSETGSTTYTAGSDMTINNLTIENMSYSSVSDVRVRFYLSSNNIITDKYDTQLGGYFYWNTFSGEAYNVMTAITANKYIHNSRR